MSFPRPDVTLINPTSRHITYRWHTGETFNEHGRVSERMVELTVTHSSHDKRYEADLHTVKVYEDGGTQRSFRLGDPERTVVNSSHTVRSAPAARYGRKALDVFAAAALVDLDDATHADVAAFQSLLPSPDSDYSHLEDPAEREWLTNVSPTDVAKNVHRIYDFMAEAGLPPESYVRELAFSKAAQALNIPYEVLYDAWLDERPVSLKDDITTDVESTMALSKQADSAERIHPLFLSYVSAVGGVAEEDATNFTDLLGDLRHFAHVRGIDFDAALHRSDLHFTHES